MATDCSATFSNISVKTKFSKQSMRYVLSLPSVPYKRDISCSLGEKNHYNLDFADEVARGSIILHEGKMMWPAPVREPSPQAVKAADPAAAAVVEPPKEPNYFQVGL